MSARLQDRVRVVAVVGLALAAVALVGCSSKKNLRKPAELKEISNPAIRLQTVWTASAGNGGGKYYSEFTLSLAPDALFAADNRGDIFAFDPRKGDRIWRSETGKRLISGPTVSGDSVLAGSMDGQLIAVRRSDGAAVWSTQLASEALSPPAGDGGRVYMRSGDGKIYGLEADNGAQQWMVDRNVPSLTLRGLSAPLVVGNRVYVGLDNGRMLALRAADGQVLWEQVVAAPTGRNELDRLTDIDAPLLSDGRELFVASFGGEIACLDDETGQILWRHSVKSYSGIARADNAIVVSDDSGTVWGLDATAGTELWKNDDLKYRQLSAPAIYQGYVVVGDYQGYLHWLDAKTGQIVARNRVSRNPIRVAPVIGDTLMYVLSSKGDIAAVKLR
jgi:outer membrane protein assembly factor BamB